MLMVTNVLKHVMVFYPPGVREEIEAEIPTIAMDMAHLGMQVLAAEQKGIRYADAVTNPEFLKMGRTYFGARIMLQWSLPPPIKEAVGKAIAHAMSGEIDHVQKIVFAIATRKHDPEAAVCRFLLWVAVQLNLLALTWDLPEIELLGALGEMEAKGETVLRDLLNVQEMSDDDVRPLHVLVAEMAIHMSQSTKKKFATTMREFGGELEELLTNAHALDQVRKFVRPKSEHVR